MADLTLSRKKVAQYLLTIIFLSVFCSDHLHKARILQTYITEAKICYRLSNKNVMLLFTMSGTILEAFYDSQEFKHISD